MKLTKQKRESIGRVAKIIVVIAGVVAIIGVIIATIAEIRTVPVIIMCFGGLGVSLASCFVSSAMDEFGPWTDFGDEEDHLRHH